MREKRVLKLRRLKREVVADALKQRAVPSKLCLFIASKFKKRQLGNARQRLPDVVHLIGREAEHVYGFFELLDRDLAPRGVVATLVQLVEAVEDVLLAERTRLELEVPTVRMWVLTSRRQRSVSTHIVG